MSEATANYATRETQTIPQSLFNFWRRLLKMERGRVYTVVLRLPREGDRITWAFMGDGKEENVG